MSELQFTWLKKGERTPDTNPLLKVSGLTVRVGMRRVLDDVDLEVYQGDHVRIIGPNGSGKSTLLNAIAGIEPARVVGGSITLKGQDITQLSPHTRTASGIAYMRQADNVFSGLTVAENLKLALGNKGPERFQKIYPEWAEEFTLNKQAGYLSGGQRKKLAFAMSVLRADAWVWLLDEPRAGVDKVELYAEGGLRDCCIIEIEHNRNSVDEIKR